MGGKEGQKLVGPFHHRHAGTVKELLQSQVEELRKALGPVGVQVIDGQPPPVLVDHDKGGARGRLGDAEPPHQPLEETGLSGAELPDGGHHIAGLEPLAQSFADPPGLLGAPALVPDLQAWTSRIAAGMASRMSPAINPSSPLASRARSPARPWRYTAASSASAGPIPRLRKAPTIPVSTSPDPPLAIPGFPVGFRQIFPAGSPMTVRAPFSATKAP